MLGMGTRPEPAKMATVYRATHVAGTDVQVLQTGQHDSMACASCDFFETPTRHVMALERDGSTLAHLHSVPRTKPQDEPEALMPRAVLPHGEPSSTGMLALAAFCSQIPVSHVATGLRSDNNADPFPEAMNCQLTSWLIRSR
jgi:UDP-N-acetylglucosamine 2-epimerase